MVEKKSFSGIQRVGLSAKEGLFFVVSFLHLETSVVEKLLLWVSN